MKSAFSFIILVSRLQIGRGAALLNHPTNSARHKERRHDDRRENARPRRQRTASVAAWRADSARGCELRRGAQGLQRHDRPAPRADRALRRRGRCHRRRQFRARSNLLVSIRGGGHNAGGLGVCDDGLVIDLSRIRYTHVHPVARTVRVGGGCTWGDVDHATHAFGLAVPSGIISTTGVGGLTLGGGIGHLTRKYGLTIDNLLAADVVLADGRFVTADKEQNADLFWALRGGGGNFGVVTSFLFQAASRSHGLCRTDALGRWSRRRR